MKNLLTLTSLFIIAMIAGANLRNGGRDLFEFDDEENELGEHEDGPEEFIKFHQGIRTRSDEVRPSYKANYQFTELSKARQFSAARKSNKSMQAESVGNGVSAFTERGPGNVPGRTRGLIVDPDSANHKTWFAGSASGGIWKTTDAGTSWQWLTSGIPNMAAAALAMAESNHNTIYAGLGEGFGLVDGVDGQGILKSTDRGVTWTFLANSTALGDVNRIAINPNDETNVIVACNVGIFKTSDGGDSWTKVYNGLVQDLRATPGNFQVLYAAQYGTGVLKSIDGGNTWNQSNTGMSPSGRVEIAVSPVKTDRIMASVQGLLSGVNSDLYMSDNGGTSWYLVTLSLANKTVDYLGTQGWYDNTVAFSPYNKDVVYVGGVGTYQVTLGSASTSGNGIYSMREDNTSSFLTLVNFSASADGGKLEVGSSATQHIVEVRFGSGLTQKAHQFLVPNGATSGVATSDYSYTGYVYVPFQVWDVTANQQLMVSFRDQNRNGLFDLIEQNTTATDATLQSREYIYISNIPYDPVNPSNTLAQAGGIANNEMYFFWPVLTTGATWDPLATVNPVPDLHISYSTLQKYTSTVKSVADVYADYDGVNNSNFVHPDQHNIVPIKQNDVSQTFQLLMANDGGVYLSGISTSPGTTQGEWKKVGNGYNTSQFYGADKKPGAQEYFGGMQDNSTYFTPSGTVSSAATFFSTSPQLAGDGFEVLWNSIDGKKMIGGSQYNYFSRSLDGGATWASAFSGLSLSSGSPDHSKFPFISKLASSKQTPDIIYTVGSQGVWRSTNFGGLWTLTALTTGWGSSSFLDAEVSRANANIVWAGGGQSSQSNLFVSTDAGKTFNAVPNPGGFILGNMSKIATDPIDQNTAYAVYSFANTAKILKTTDLGQTWSDISGFVSGSSTTGFPDVAVYSLYVRPDNTNILWAGTEIGIVESLDGGASWALLTEFPSVAVWDMKGQDNEIVIATHGRGIWTATVAKDQNANFAPSQVLATGTSPQDFFKLKIHVPVQYDSVQIKLGTKSVTFSPPDSGTYILQISNVSFGNVAIQLISYKGSAPVYSQSASGIYFALQPYQNKYYNYFTSVTDFYLNGLSLQSFGLSNSSLQTAHPYVAGKTASATLLVPIIVSSGGNTSFIYDDVTLVQPGTAGSVFGQPAFNDYVVAEATKNGLDWLPIANGYNSSAAANWLSAYTNAQTGDISFTKTENFDLKNKFSAGDTILVRLSLYANSDNITSWGWSVDNLYIQQTPTAVELPNEDQVSVYPNPTDGKFKVNYTLTNDSEISINTWDATGRAITSQNFGTQPEGQHQIELNLDSSPEGIYLIRFRSNAIEKTMKVLLRK